MQSFPLLFTVAFHSGERLNRIFPFRPRMGKRRKTAALQKLVRSKRRRNLRSVLECARPSALFLSFPNSRGRGIQNRLRLIDRAFAFRIKCVVNNKLALTNLVVRQSNCPKTARDPTQTFASGVRIGWPRISRADNFTEK